MFERFADTVTVVRAVRNNDLPLLAKLINAGAKIDRRTGVTPWETPLDAAASTGNLTAARMLLEAGSPIFGSSIFDAIAIDCADILKLFRLFDPQFFGHFRDEPPYSQNPRLNRWTLEFSALDFAASFHASECISFLESIGAKRQSRRILHKPTCSAVFIQEESFVSIGGVVRDGLTEVTCGYYCAKCGMFIRVASEA